MRLFFIPKQSYCAQVLSDVHRPTVQQHWRPENRSSRFWMSLTRLLWLPLLFLWVPQLQLSKFYFLLPLMLSYIIFSFSILINHNTATCLPCNSSRSTACSRKTWWQVLTAVTTYRLVGISFPSERRLLSEVALIKMLKALNMPSVRSTSYNL